jgi:hypothetical protein
MPRPAPVTGTDEYLFEICERLERIEELLAPQVIYKEADPEPLPELAEKVAEKLAKDAKRRPTAQKPAAKKG